MLAYLSPSCFVSKYFIGIALVSPFERRPGLFVALLSAWTLALAGAAAAPAQATVPSGALIHLEARASVDAGRLAEHVATCNSRECFENDVEDATASRSFCDTAPPRLDGAEGGCPAPATDWDEPADATGFAAYGCSRFAVDHASAEPWQMDDSQKLCLKKSCAAGKACFAGHAQVLGNEIWSQGATLELPASSTRRVESGADFHLFSVLKAVPSAARGCLAGNALHHLCVEPDGGLFLRLGAFNVDLASSGTVPLGSWIALELSRTAGSLRVLIDGEDVTAGAPSNTDEPFVVTYFMSTFKGADAFEGEVAGLWLYDRALGSTELQDLRAYGAETYGVGSGSVGGLRFDAWPDKFVVQRTFDPEQGTWQADRAVSGRLIGSGSSLAVESQAVEIRAVDAETLEPVTPWTAAAVTDPVDGSWSGSIPDVPQGGWYRLQARLAAEPYVGALSRERFGVGMVVAALGQSNMVKLFTEDEADGSVSAPFETAPDLAWRYGYGEPPGYPYARPRAADIPVSWGPVTGSGGIRLARNLADRLGIPVLILDFSLDWTGLLQHWNDVGGFVGWQRFAAALDQMTGLEAVLWHQGAYDAHEPYAYENDVVTVAEHKAGLDALYQQIVTRRPESADGGPLPMLVAIQNRGVYDDVLVKDDAYNAVRRAQLEWIAERAHGFSAGSSLDLDISAQPWAGSGHFWADEYQLLADRYTRALLHAVDSPPDSDGTDWNVGVDGPRLLDATLYGRTVRLRVQHDAGSRLRLEDPAGLVEGFTVTDGDWVTADGQGGLERHEIPLAGARLSDDQPDNWIELELGRDPVGPVKIRHLYGQNVFHFKTEDTEQRRNGNTVYDDFEVLPGTVGLPLLPTTEDLIASPVGGIQTDVDALSVTENGSAVFQVSLDYRSLDDGALDPAPSGDVVVELELLGDGDFGFGPAPSTERQASLQFAAGSTTAQAVTVSAVADADAEIGSAVVRLSAPGFASRVVELFEIDADPYLVVTDTDLSVGRLGGTDTFQVSLGVPPASPVELDVIVSDGAWLSATPSLLRFEPGDWDEPRTVTVTGRDGGGAVPNDVYVRLRVNPATSDDHYDPLPDTVLPVSVLDLNAGLLLHWPLDTVSDSGMGTETPDLGPNGLHGIVGVDVESAAGVEDGALRTVGPGGTAGSEADGIRVDPFVSGDGRELTVSLWYRPDAAKHDGYLFHWGGTYDDVNALSAYLDVGVGLRIRVHDEADESSVEQITPAGFDTNGWHHLAVVKDGSGSRFYFDGRPAGSALMGAGRLLPTQGFALGMNEIGTYGAELDFDDVRLYGRALADAEILEIYGQSADSPVTVHLGPDDLPADARWAFVDGSGAPETLRSSGETVERAPGLHTLRFFDAAGFLTPADRQVEVRLGEPLAWTELYGLPGRGGLRVDVAPDGAASSGARFFLLSDPAATYAGGEVLSLPVGTYDVGFTELTDWVTPSPVTVDVDENQVATATGVYVAEGDLAPILHLKLDETELDETAGSTAIDSSGFGRHGVYGAEVVLGGAGIDGGAAQTQGSGFTSGSSAQGVVVPDVDGDSYDAATVSFWYRRVAERDGYLFTWGGSYNDPGSISVYLDVGTGLRVRVHDDGDGASVLETAPSGFDDGRWHHLVITKSPAGTDIYWDGLHHASHPMGVGLLTPRDRLSLGMNELGTYGATADMDDLILWQRALGAGEVAELYTASAKARLSFTLAPGEVQTLGAGWRVGSSPVYESGAVVDVPLGRAPGDTSAQDVTVTFESVDGWITPSPLTVELEAGAVWTGQAAYLSADSASLRVDLGPAGLDGAGGWRVQGSGSPWSASGATEILGAGTYTVECLAVPGWTAPQPISVELVAGSSEVLSVTYEEVRLQEPILDLPLDETSGTAATDVSGFGQDGVYGDGMVLGRPGVGPDGSGTAARSTGSGGNLGSWADALAVPTFADGRSFSEATVAFWYRVDPGSADGYLFHWGGTYTDPDSLSIYLDLGTGLRIRVHDTGDTSSTLQVAPSGAHGRFDDAGWHHLAVTKGATGSDVYFDGVRVASHPMGSQIMRPTGSTGLGSNELGTYGLTADFDGLKIWQRALDGTEIEDLFTASAVGRLRVDLVPGDVTAQATWRLAVDDPGVTRSSGETVILPSGSYGVLFGAVPGWTTPQDMTVQVGIGDGVGIVGDYAAGAPTPIVHWPLDVVTDGQTPDISGFGRHGQVGSRVAPGLQGVDGGAMQTAGLGLGEGTSLDGISVPLSFDRPLTELTVAFWYRLGAEPHNGYLFNWGGTHRDENAVSVFLDVGQELRVRVHDDGDRSSVVPMAAAGFDDAGWHHLAIVKDATGTAVYFDGSLASQALTGAGPLWPVGGFDLGMNESDRYGVEATFDEVRLYNRALDGAEVADLVSSVTVPDGFGGAYRTVDELRLDLEGMATAYPQILELVDYGDSYAKTVGGLTVTSGDLLPGDDLLAARVTRLDTLDSGNLDPEARRPVFVLMACLHAREIGTPELAMRYLEHLLTSYGEDADVTWLVDHHEIWILPLVNPDGHRLVEAGALAANGSRPWGWRKNVRQNGSCAWPPSGGDTFGVDLNRNFPYQWGILEGVGGSSDSCDAYHRGASGGSEPETQAVMSLMSSLIPDQRPSSLVAAPDDTTGVFIQLHSPFRTVAWPWAYGSEPSPNEFGLRAVGEKLAARNGYTADQAHTAVYAMSGTADDWVHGELGAPAFLLEVGEGLMPAFNRVENTLWPENRDAFAFAAKIARTPYLTVQGPEIVSLQTTSSVADRVRVDAVADDGAFGAQSLATVISQVEVYVGAAPWETGAAPVGLMAPVDGSLNGKSEAVFVELDVSAWATGRHQVFVRAQDAEGMWGPVSSIFVDRP